MADMKLIHDFAMKWGDKFRDHNINYTELLDQQMAEDCNSLGFEMDFGHAFERVYGAAVNNSDELMKVIDDITDISLLGSAIYSRWRYFNHSSSNVDEILEPKNRAWFITALERLSELSKLELKFDQNVVILFPAFAALKEEIEKLHTEISMLFLERDELKYVVCKNIEMKYMLSLGALEYKAYELYCSMLRLKRMTELIQAKTNRQEKVSISAINRLLDEEFAEYQKKLNEQIEKMNEALEWRKRNVLTEDETQELKSLYRTIIKTLHPDIHPDVSAAQIELFQNAVGAYENGDLITLRIIKEMIAESVLPEPSENALTVLMKDKERLLKLLEIIKIQIKKIKEGYPYTLKPIVDSEELTAKRIAELEATIAMA